MGWLVKFTTLCRGRGKFEQHDVVHESNYLLCGIVGFVFSPKGVWPRQESHMPFKGIPA